MLDYIVHIDLENLLHSTVTVITCMITVFLFYGATQ